MEHGGRRGSVAVAGTWYQEGVSGCGWNIVSERGQWMWLEHGGRIGSVAVAGTWCQEGGSQNTCSFNHVLQKNVAHMKQNTHNLQQIQNNR